MWKSLALALAATAVPGTALAHHGGPQDVAVGIGAAADSPGDSGGTSRSAGLAQASAARRCRRGASAEHASLDTALTRPLGMGEGPWAAHRTASS